MFADDWQSFFNLDEFAIQAVIKGILVNGILESSLSTVNQVHCIQFKFTCAQAAIPNVKLDERVRIDNHSYRILEIKPDGTGLVSLSLEHSA